jgi:hypothetical protein
LLWLGLLFFAWWSVYTRYVDLHAFDLVTNMPFRDLSLKQYEDTIAGVRTFPYQWRVLAFWLVKAIETITHLDPHLIDVAIKTLALAGSTALLVSFAKTIVAPMSAVLTGVLYLLITAAAFASEGYAIYFTNDYLVMLGWFGGVVAVNRRAWFLAALATFFTAWAKETAVLIVILVAFEAWRRRAPWSALAMCAVAFVVPTAVLRTLYPAPIQQWAWWDTFRLNIPFLVWQAPIITKALRDNLKVLLFLNVLWFWAYLGWRRSQHPLVASLAWTLACYVVMAWTVVYIRELRHMLPFTILVLPLAVAELEARLR